MAGGNPILTELGVCEQDIVALRHECGRMPGVIEELDEQAQQARDRIDHARSEVEAAEKLRRTRESEIQDCETLRGRFQGQSALVKTNVEYTALLREIDGVTERISRLEEEALLAMEEIDMASARLTDVEREQSRVEVELHRKAAEQRALLEDARARLDEREKQRSELVPQLGPEIERIYRRVATRGGIAVSPLVGGSCSACHRSIPPELQNRVIAGDVRTCPNCLAIIVIPPDA